MFQEMWVKMDIYDKIEIINAKLNNINFHIEGLMTGFDEGVGDQELLDQFLAKKLMLEDIKNSLTNS